MAAEARVIDMSDLKDLDPLAPRLKAASDDLTKALQTIQERLNTLQIGIEVWAGALNTSDWRDILDRDQEPTKFREYTATELGYGRLGDGWGLLVRRRRYVEGPDANGFQATEAYDDGDMINPSSSSLLRASRELRVAAVPLIPKLIEVLKHQAKELITRVEQAKQIAESLE